MGHRIAARLILAILILVGAMPVLASAQTAGAGPAAAPTSTVQVQALPSTPRPTPAVAFDAEKATNAYLARINGAARARSDSYFEGGYVLQVIDAIYAIGIMALLLWLRISTRMRDIAVGISRRRFWQVPIYFVQFTVLTTVLSFPLTVYETFIREHAYGLSNQNFLQWFGDFGTGFAVSLVAFSILATLVYAAIRASGPRWWIWGTFIATVFFAVGALIAPVFIAPLFNHYTPLPEGPTKAAILTLARANGVPADNVYEFNESLQSKRVSANVSGLFNTTRISVTDNLLTRGTTAEAKAILGHEIGHYVLDHVIQGIVYFFLVFLAAFAFVNWAFNYAITRFGGAWNIRKLDDPAGLPVIYAAVTVFLLLTTPVLNTIIRTQEAQADIFGINASREPDAWATSILKLSEYRKLEPSALEEFVFYDHPAGRNRIFMAMRWKAQHINDPDIKAGPVSPQ